jgi:PIN domain nuclease of toxin-antitoxin system
LTVLDAYAIVALLLGEPAAEEVAGLLERPGQPASASVINLAEVVDVLVRINGRPIDAVMEKLDWLTAGGLESVDVDEGLAIAAGRIRAKHYERVNQPLSLADCVALATAVAMNEPLATADPPLAAAAADEGCKIVALPDSRGRRPKA